MSVAAPAPATAAGAGAGGAGRLWEVDVFRTVAIALMVIYHLAYDIDLLYDGSGLDPFNGWLRGVQVACGSSFLSVVGISFWISNQRSRARGLTGVDLWRKHAKRALQVLAAAAAVSVGTLVALGTDDYVKFGILHLIGTTVLVILPLTVRFGIWNLPLGVAMIVAGFIVREVDSDIPGALVLGFFPEHGGVDWYPILPWAGVALIGLAVGSLLYPDGRRGPLLDRLLPPASQITLRAGAPGRHALPFYLVHQPVLIALTAAVLTVAGATVDWP